MGFKKKEKLVVEAMLQTLNWAVYDASEAVMSFK